MTIQFLKLGGSLITDKSVAHTVRRPILTQIASEIAAYHRDNPEQRLILGHGSGSFGHIPAKKHRTKDGVSSAEAWRGFAEVHSEASALNRIVLDTLRDAGLPVLSFSALDSFRCENGTIVAGPADSVRTVLDNGLIPLVFGDTVLDTVRGGTICSTEDLFQYLIGALGEEATLLLAGIEDGVYADFPERTRLLTEIREPKNSQNGLQFIQESIYTDVTGGMKSKIAAVFELLACGNVSEARIFSGARPGNVGAALRGDPIGTRILR